MLPKISRCDVICEDVHCIMAFFTSALGNVIIMYIVTMTIVLYATFPGLKSETYDPPIVQWSFGFIFVIFFPLMCLFYLAIVDLRRSRHVVDDAV